jgi:hypothetical protein
MIVVIAPKDRSASATIIIKIRNFRIVHFLFVSATSSTAIPSNSSLG